MARKPIIAGNWKMNMTPAEAKELISALIPLVQGAEADVVICPPYLAIPTAAELVKGTNIALGAQNIHWAEKGAFTGEIATNMLVDAGCKYVIIGHSER
ncbi:MAG: triosephosphate isomerase, partial [Clostridia bacterium]|nr:triosephosphate isomerase [Clostridia bacterium]